MDVVVIGGTGMLLGVVQEMVTRGHRVCVVARRPDGAPVEGSYVPVAADWHDPSELAARVTQVMSEPDLIVVWAHGSHGVAVIESLRPSIRPGTRVVHVMGSAAAAPDATPPAELHGVDVRRVVLGFTGPPGRSRWLTHAEIVAGVVSAIDTDPGPAVQLAGRVEPWSDRP